MDTKSVAHAPRCSGCGRHPRTCWTMPCLLLDIARAEGLEAVQAWGRAAGLEVRDADGGLGKETA